MTLVLVLEVGLMGVEDQNIVHLIVLMTNQRKSCSFKAFSPTLKLNLLSHLAVVWTATGYSFLARLALSFLTSRS